MTRGGNSRCEIMHCIVIVVKEDMNGERKLEQYYKDRARMCSTDRDGGGTIAMLNPHKMLLLFF